MTPYFILTCYFCGVDGHIRPNCFKYIKMCRVESMVERKRTKANMHVPRKIRANLHDPRKLEPLYKIPLGRKMFHLGGLEEMNIFAMLSKLP